tara:strand:- start:9 stop:416 length:408 start_codon:yes stop_codon:yes gene_type:complete
MIIGIGTDILDQRRIKKIINKYDHKFIDRIYGKKEIQIAKSKLNDLENYFGKRFAAKEATWKALSSTRGKGIFFREIETLNDTEGKPYLFFTGKTKDFIKKKEIQLKAKLKFDISLSDDNPYIIAFVIISLAPYV